MMKIVALVIQAIGVAGGVTLGLYLKNPAPTEAPAKDGAGEKDAKGDKKGDKKKDAKDKKKDGKDKKADKGKDKKKKDAKDKKGDYGDGDTPPGYLKFSRQFIVPVLSASGSDSMIVMEINLDLEPSITSDAYSLEPRLRDALLTKLLDLSNDGAFTGEVLSEKNLNKIRKELRKATYEILEKDDVKDVLILSIARQKF